jgi:hypothetical protein
LAYLVADFFGVPDTFLATDFLTALMTTFGLAITGFFSTDFLGVATFFSTLFFGVTAFFSTTFFATGTGVTTFLATGFLVIFLVTIDK